VATINLSFHAAAVRPIPVAALSHTPPRLDGLSPNQEGGQSQQAHQPPPNRPWLPGRRVRARSVATGRCPRMCKPASCVRAWRVA